MFEDRTAAAILAEMMDTARDDVDKSEGSLLWESLSATAMEFEVAYTVALEETINNAFIPTADREHLERHAETYSIFPYPASHAVVQADFTLDKGVEVEVGSQFTYNQIFYTVVEKVSEAKYNLQCNEAGTIGNRTYGQLLPVFSLPGFRSADITALLIPGEDVEGTEDFRQRVIQSISGKAFGGNALDYIQEVNSIAGVGDCKIIRCPRGKGTVDVLIIDSEFKPASEELVGLVQNTLRPLDITGPPDIDNCGTGLVPIGHDTIVKAARGVELEVGFELVYDDGYNYGNVKGQIEEALKAYCAELAANWGDTRHYQESIQKDYADRFVTIQVNKVGSILFGVPGVHDYVQGSITINGSAGDIDLEYDEVPVFKGAVDNGQ